MTEPETWTGSSRSRFTAWLLLALTILGFVVLAWLIFRVGGWQALAEDMAAAVLLVAFFVGLGTLLALRRPGNPIGWLLAAGGLAWLVGGFAENVARQGLSADRNITVMTGLAANLNENFWTVGMLCSVGLPLLLFPDGRTYSRRWRWVLLAMVSGCAAALVGGAVSTNPINSRVPDPPVVVANPWGVERFSPVWATARGIGTTLLMLTILIAAVGVVVRFRSATGVERQQLRWVRAGALLAVAGMLSVAIGSGLLGLPGSLTNVLVTIGVGCVPMSITVAVLRYRLYDLDRIVSRTVTYAAVTALLVGTYVALVTGVSRLTPSGSSIAVAASTLAVAALFQPLRRRVQQRVDQRFNRARYDAQQTVDAFARRLREQVDLDLVRADLLAVAHQTLQPTSVAIWLRDQGPVTR